MHNTEYLTLRAVDGILKLRLQVHPGMALDMTLLADRAGIALPGSPQEKTGTEKSIYWLAPNDWLLLDPAATADALGAALRDASAGATCAVTDVSAAWSIIDVSGEDAAAKLAEGCSLDLYPGAFPAGCYALTRLQHLPVIIHRLDYAGKFRILADRSHTRYLRDWLVK